MAELYRVTTTISGMSGGPAYNQLYFDVGSLQDGQTAAAIAGEFWGACDAIMDSQATWTTGAEVDKVESTTGLTTGVETITPVTGVGAWSGDPVPFASQGLIRLRTGFYIGGRELRGRVFVPYLATSALAGGKVAPSSLTALNAAGDSLEQTGCVVFSPTHKQYAPVISATAWGEFASLRSRRD